MPHTTYWLSLMAIDKLGNPRRSRLLLAMRKHVLQLAPIYGITCLAAFLYSVTCDVKTGKAVQTSQQLRGRHGRSTLPNIF